MPENPIVRQVSCILSGPRFPVGILVERKYSVFFFSVFFFVIFLFPFFFFWQGNFFNLCLPIPFTPLPLFTILFYFCLPLTTDTPFPIFSKYIGLQPILMRKVSMPCIPRQTIIPYNDFETSNTVRAFLFLLFPFCLRARESLSLLLYIGLLLSLSFSRSLSASLSFSPLPSLPLSLLSS